jgi:hypothetical protein
LVQVQGAHVDVEVDSIEVAVKSERRGIVVVWREEEKRGELRLKEFVPGGGRNGGGGGRLWTRRVGVRTGYDSQPSSSTVSRWCVARASLINIIRVSSSQGARA